MSDNRDVAKQILLEAGNTILKDRPGIHGSAENSFEMIADFWTVYIRHVYRTRGIQQLRGEDVAEMMTMLKKARKVYGASSNVDNDIDDVGYAALAGMLRLPDPATSDEQDLNDAIGKEALKPDIPVAKHGGIDPRGTAERQPSKYGYNLAGNPMSQAEYDEGDPRYPSPEAAEAARNEVKAHA